MSRNAKVPIAVFVAVLSLAAFLPIPYDAAPAWDVWVVDETDRPLEGMKVRLSFQNYSAETEHHELDAITNKQGRVSFPSQRASASIPRFMLYSARSAASGVHASFGRHASVFAFGHGRAGSATADDVVTDWTGSPPEMKSRIVARQLPELQR